MTSTMQQLFQMPTLEPQTIQNISLPPPQLQPMIHTSTYQSTSNVKSKSPCPSSINPPILSFEGKSKEFDDDDKPPVLDKVEPTKSEPLFPTLFSLNCLNEQNLTPTNLFTPNMSQFLQLPTVSQFPSTTSSTNNFIDSPASSLLKLFQQQQQQCYQQQQHCYQQQLNVLNYSQLLQNFPQTLANLSNSLNPSKQQESKKMTNQKNEPSISIEIKETKNPLLEKLMAQVSSSNQIIDESLPKLTMEVNNDQTDDEEINVDDIDDDMPVIEKICKEELTECPPDLPPSLEKVVDNNLDIDIEGEDEPPPELQPFDLPVEATNQLLSSPDDKIPAIDLTIVKTEIESPKNTVDTSTEIEFDTMAVVDTKTPLKRGRGRPPKKLLDDKRKSGESQKSSSPEVFKAKIKHEPSTSSGVSSYDDNESPSCSPLAPINGNNRRSTRIQKESSKTSSKLNLRSRKRKSESPMKGESSKKRSKTCKNVYRKSQRKQSFSESFWVPVGKPFAEYVHVENESAPKPSCCYPAVKHKTENVTFHNGDVICVSAEENEPDNIGKINRIFRDKTGKLCVSVFWYYRYDQCTLKNDDKQAFERKNIIHERELMASRHLDTIPCDSIQSHAYVLTLSEYCRYVAENKLDMLSEKMQSRYKEMWTRGEDNYPRRHLSPHEDSIPELVYFCRRYYSLGKKKIFNGFPNNTNQRKIKNTTKNATKPLISIDEDRENKFISTTSTRNGKRMSS